MKRRAALALLAVALSGLSAAVYAQDQRPLPEWWGYSLKAFTHSSESMLPTIRPISYLIANKQAAGSLRRGDMIVFRIRNEVWVKRVVGLPGDRVAMVDGRVKLNGRFAEYGRPEAYSDLPDPSQAGSGVHRLTERLDGESESHSILDQGPMHQDDVAETIVARDHVYVLGDNRDDSIDSRFPDFLGPVAFADIYGVVAPRHIRWLRAPQRPAPPKPTGAIEGRRD